MPVESSPAVQEADSTNAKQMEWFGTFSTLTRFQD